MVLVAVGAVNGLRVVGCWVWGLGWLGLEGLGFRVQVVVVAVVVAMVEDARHSFSDFSAELLEKLHRTSERDLQLDSVWQEQELRRNDTCGLRNPACFCLCSQARMGLCCSARLGVGLGHRTLLPVPDRLIAALLNFASRGAHHTMRPRAVALVPCYLQEDGRGATEVHVRVDVGR